MATKKDTWPDAKTRDTIRVMLGVGVTVEQVCRLTKDPTTGKAITEARLRELFGDEIDTAELLANAQVLGSLFKHATGGGKEAVKAALHWVSTHKTKPQQEDLETRIKEALLLSERLMTRNFE